MSVWKVALTCLFVGLVAASEADARGGYRGGFYRTWSSSGCYGRSYHTYAPVVVTAPTRAVEGAPAAEVARAPSEGRRFSYEPSAEPAPEPIVTEGARPFSESQRSRASMGGSMRSSQPTWAMPKTDPHRYRVGR